MMTDAEFNKLIDRIIALGFGEEQACALAARIGDTPEIDERGRTVVRDEAGAVLARLELPW